MEFGLEVVGMPVGGGVGLLVDGGDVSASTE